MLEDALMESSDGAHQRQRQRRVADRERKRAVRACDGCRRQKEKCDGGVPCRRCVRLRRQCEFLGPGAVSVKHSNGHSAPESAARLQAASQGNEELAERLKHMETLLHHYAGDINLDDADNLRQLAQAVDKDPMSPRREASVSQGSDYLGAEEENFTVQPLGNNITHYSGEFSHWNFSMRIKQWIEQCVPDQNRPGNTSSLNFKEYYRPEELQSASDAFTSLASLPPRYVTDILVNSFFQHAETNYFYVERDWLLAKLDLAYENASALTRRDVGTVCIIFIVLAIGTQYLYLNSPKNEQEATGPFSEDAIGVMFYQQACKLVPDVITVSSLESVQACLLIGIYTLPLDASGLSYIYLNLAVKLAVQNGMHRKYPGEGLDPVVKETRSRVWWTAYTTERRVGIFHGRPISISSVDIDAEKPVDRTDLWPSSSPNHIQAMLATLQLHDILSRISQEISVLKTHAKHGSFDTLSRLIDLKNELHRWRDHLPESIWRKDDDLSSPSCTTSRPITRCEMHLRLEFCLVRMFAGRPFIFLRVPSRSNASSSASPAEQHTQQHQQHPPQQPSHPQQHPQQQQPASSPRTKTDSRSILVTDCVEAALSVISTCKHLRDTVGAARASYTEFSACRAAVLVIITQCLQAKTERLRQALKDGVAMIKVMSAGGESARSEASLIEVFERAIARLDGPEDGVMLGSGAMGGVQSDYARFKKWEMLWKNESPIGGASGSISEQTGGPRMSGDRSVQSPSDTPGPMPPPPLVTGGLWGGNGMDFGRSGTTPVQAMTPSAAAAAAASMDWNFASFPQTMDEFSSMFMQGSGPSPDSMGSMGGPSNTMWMGQ